MTSSRHASALFAIFAKSAAAALLLAAPLFGAAAEPAQSGADAAAPSCNSVMTKTREFRDAPREQIEGICRNNRNSPAYWSCMSRRIDRGQGFADAGVRCNKITKATASR